MTHATENSFSSQQCKKISDEERSLLESRQPFVFLKRIDLQMYERGRRYRAARQKQIALCSAVDHLRKIVIMNESPAPSFGSNSQSNSSDKNSASDERKDTTYSFSNILSERRGSDTSLHLSLGTSSSSSSKASDESPISNRPASRTNHIGCFNKDENFHGLKNCCVLLKKYCLPAWRNETDNKNEMNIGSFWSTRELSPQESVKEELDINEENDYPETWNENPELIIAGDQLIDRIKRHLAKTRNSYRIYHIRSQLLIGSHVSKSGNFAKCLDVAARVEALALSFFIGSVKSWNTKPVDEKEARDFRKKMRKSPFNPGTIVPHGNYLINLASPDDTIYSKSLETFETEVKNCECLGLRYYNFHPGSTLGKISNEAGVSKVAAAINSVLSKTKSITILIENSSGKGSTLGSKFSELKRIIDNIENKSRVGVCLDICHAFAAGYDLSTKVGFDHMMDDFTNIIGLHYLVAFHMNDSYGSCGSKIDRHVAIGLGRIGIRGFHAIVNDPRVRNKPLILETPGSTLDAQQQIQLLYSLWHCSDSVLDKFYVSEK